MRQRFIINLKPIIERLDAQGEILCSVQSDVNSIFMSQASTSKELSQVKNAVWWFNKEMGSMKSMLSEILKARSEEDVPRPLGLAEQVAGPSGPAAAASQAEVSESRPAGPVEQVQKPAGPAEKVLGPSGPVESVSIQPVAEEEAVAPEPPAPSSTQTPELLGAGELWIDHKKDIFFPRSSAATCTNCPLEADQRITLCQNRESLVRNPKHCPFSIGFRQRPYERDGLIGRVLRSCRDSKPVAF
ncbi:hypothetical protein Taro_038207 [Colocasia esculenta]|uniref:Uncharacterized protein n=1 Tax=Colocasia esculenta TaxID=4460 RepID=A0A843W7L0_COLES|nr:hypothetical protein [Colocasia esculenta]